MKLQQSGFSLLEILLGALLCTLALGGFAATSVLQERSMKLYRNHNFSRFLAVQEMESALAQDYGNLTSYASTTPKDISVIREVDGIETTQTFQVTVTIPSADDISTDIIVQADFLEDESPPFEVRTTVFYTQ